MLEALWLLLSMSRKHFCSKEKKSIACLNLVNRLGQLNLPSRAKERLTWRHSAQKWTAIVDAKRRYLLGVVEFGSPWVQKRDSSRCLLLLLLDVRHRLALAPWWMSLHIFDVTKLSDNDAFLMPLPFYTIKNCHSNWQGKKTWWTCLLPLEMKTFFFIELVLTSIVLSWNVFGSYVSWNVYLVVRTATVFYKSNWFGLLFM